MPAKKKATTTSKKETVPKKEVVKAENAKCDCEKCDCKDCHCATAVSFNQISFYIFIALLVATMTVLVMSLSFNRSVRDLFRPATYAYNGAFDKAAKENHKDENGIPTVTAAATIDMVSNKSGYLIVCDVNNIDCEVFARRVANYEGEKSGNIYRYDAPSEETADSKLAKEMLGYTETPEFLYIKDGKVFDRIDDVQDFDDLAIFLEKYN